MKTFLTSLTLTLLIAFSASAQSRSFETLKEKFSGQSEVYSFSTSGFLARTVMRMAGEGQYTRMFKDVRNVRLMVIPKKAFQRQQLTLRGFIKFSQQEGFEELGHFREHGDEVTVMIQTPKKKADNRYMVLVDDNNEVVAVELKGYIDPEDILNPDRKLAYSNH